MDVSSKKQKISLETVISRKEEVTTAELDGDICMLDIETGKYYALDAVGSDIWSLISDPRTTRDIIAQLLKAYEIDEETCQSQVLDFLGELNEKNMLVIH